MARYQKDQFDDQLDDLLRVGAHRGAPRKGRGWITFAWAALATGVLVVGGLYGLSKVAGIAIDFPLFGSGSTPTTTPTPTPTAKPLTDPKTLTPARAISITVLNGSPTAQRETTVGDALAAAGWPIGARTSASEKTVTKTFIYYSNPANEDVARGLMLALGFGEIRLSDAFPGAPVTIVLGSDYVAPPAK